MHRRGLFIGAAVATATILTPGVASAETKAESYGVELDKYIESRPGLREIVEEQSQHLDREEIRKTLEALKEISEQAPIDSTTSSRESGDGDAPVIVPMKRCASRSTDGWYERSLGISAFGSVLCKWLADLRLSRLQGCPPAWSSVPSGLGDPSRSMNCSDGSTLEAGPGTSALPSSDHFPKVRQPQGDP